MIIPSELAPVWELFFVFDVVTCVLTAEMAFVVFNQWHSSRREGAKSYLFLSFSVFFLLLATGIPIFVLRRYFSDAELFDLNYRVGLAMMGIGCIFFSIMLEWEFRQHLRTHFIISALNATFLILVLSITDINLSITILNPVSFSMALIPIFFIIYLFFKSSGRSRGKMTRIIIGTLGICLLLLTYTDRGLQTILDVAPNPGNFLLGSKIIYCISVPIMISGFTGRPLLLEMQWKNNLFSFYIIEEKTGRLLFQKDFQKIGPKTVDDAAGGAAEFIAGGITGVIKLIQEITHSTQILKVIDQEKVKILLEPGKSITGAFIVKKNLGNLQYFLLKITRRIDEVFSLTPELFEQDRESIVEKVLQEEFGTKFEEVP